MNSPLVPPSHIPSSQPAVPQIRSRITVVCAECKRLKLKCDRRNPCGSCTKRDTVSRCIYSPAAAEKVDLHSLNNRLIQVEATLSLITSGQTPPVFQSSYPYSQIQPNTVPNIAISHSLNNRLTTQTPTGLSHQHHHHNSATFTSANDSISLSSEDLSSIWLDELDDVDSSPFDVKISRPWKTDASFVKLETSSYAPFDENTSQLLPHATHVHVDLPPISVYYATPERISGISETQTSTPCTPPQSDTFNGTTPASKPSITPSLVALLPSLVRTRQLLRNAVGVLRERPVPLPASLLSSLSDGINGAGADVSKNNIKGKKGKNKSCFPSLTTHWDALEFRVMWLITKGGLGRGTSAKATDRKEREKMSARARAIFFGGGSSSAVANAEPSLTPQSRTQNPKRDTESEFDVAERTTKERGESLPFFAAVCLLLALGTTASQTTEQEGSESHVNPPGQSSMGSETESAEFFYHLAQQSLDVWEDNLSVPSAEDKEAVKAEEDEKLDYLVASLLAVGYQLYEPFARRKGKDSERRRINALNKAFSLVGKMVNMARAMGLGKDRKSPVRCKDEPDALNGKDAKKKVRADERRKRKDDLKRLIWWDIGFYELFISDALGHSSLLSSSPCMIQFPRELSPSNDELESGQDDAQQEPKSNQDEEFSVHEIVEKYHSARCRLTKIAQTIKQKLTHPDCCCGYTLDQAAQLEGEVNRFLEGLPPPLRFFFKEEGKEVTTGRSQDMQPSTTDVQKSMQRVQCCELAIMAQRLIMMVYLPFLRQHSESRSSNFSSAAATATPSDHSTDSTGQKNDDSAWNPALQPTVNAAQCTIQASKALLQWPISDGPPDQLLAPSLLDLYPLEKTLLDAVIICTHATTFHGTLFFCHQTLEYASSALEMLIGMDLGSNHKTLLERVKKRFNITIQSREPPSLYGVKRKHDSNGTEGRGRGPEASKSYTYSSHPSTEVQLTGDRVSQQAAQIGIHADLTKPRAGSACSGRDPETGQKNKKHAKKNHQYPAVGIRVRQRKDGLPVFLRNRVDSPSTSVPNPDTESSAETPQQERRVQMNAIVTPVDEQDLASLGNFGPSQHQQPPRDDPSPPVMSSLLDDPRYQSSSASLSQDLHLHSQSQHESRPDAVTYSATYIEMYEQGQKLSPQEVHMSSSHSDSFDGNKNHDVSNAFNHVSRISGPVESNPYGTSCHLSSSSSSPYLADGSGMTPLTPFRSATQTITSSSYAQEPSVSSNSHTHAYYHMDPEASYSGVCDHPESTPPYGSMGLDASTEASTPVIRATSSTGMSNSAFEERHAAMYDVKVPLEGLIHPPIHHNHMLQHPPYNVDQPSGLQPAVLHLPSPMSQPQTWAHHTDSCPPRFWDTSPSSTGEYKYIH